MRPRHAGDVGDIYYNGTTACMGGTEWVDRIPREEPPLVPFTQKLSDLRREQ